MAGDQSYTTAPDAMSVDVTLRNGVEWSDGQPFTSDDVKYTIELLRDTPSLVFAADMKEWVKDVTVTDPTALHHRPEQAERPLLLLSTSSRTPRSTSRSCPSTSGRARTRRRSTTSI